jgi:hypothetical protein
MSKKIPEYRFRSRFERRFAADLRDRRIEFEYEQYKFPYQPSVKTYTPDFYLPDFDLFIETKGLFTYSDRQKHLCIQEQHPDMDLRFVFMAPHNKLSRKSKSTYSSWCTAKGFLFSDERIPKEWTRASSKKKVNP